MEESTPMMWTLWRNLSPRIVSMKILCFLAPSRVASWPLCARRKGKNDIREGNGFKYERDKMKKYVAINNWNLEFYVRMLSDREILDFFRKFTKSTSKDLQFVFDDLSTSDTSSVGVVWHLDMETDLILLIADMDETVFNLQLSLGMQLWYVGFPSFQL
ncbi:Peptidyl-prolyl cis-trans isomerase FKBP53 [Senna tora]|uniref:Peptidyl-prolyl cis-trans isomerase FKBP53 n=1 Tax=Senna tora TaxID=362788 RepID=A0A834XKA1_9FABA|nr:Peptidyl-prolyl cis-trans isomerase FKBP53 [Senna tora]